MKIMFFDYWTEGIKNFLRLFDPLKVKGADIILVHLGSWNDKNQLIEQTIEGLVCRDIKYYSGNILKAIQKENPDIVLGLNYTHTMDRAIRACCRNHNIKAVYLMHGVRSTEPDQIDFFINSTNSSLGITGRIKRIPRYLKILWFYFLQQKGNKFGVPFDRKLLQYLWEIMISPGKAVMKPNPHPDLWWDYFLVYSQNYKRFLVEEIGCPPNQVIITGNPELDSAIALWNDPRCVDICHSHLADISIKPWFNGNRFIFYVEEALVEMGFITEEKRLNEIEQIASCAKAQGYDILLKLHPCTNSTAITNRFSRYPHIHIFREGDLAKLTFLSQFVMGHSSTVLSLPIVIGRPIFELFDPIYGQGIYNSIISVIKSNELEDMMANPEDIYFTEERRRKISEFIEKEIGPTDGNAIQRIVECLITNCSSTLV